MAKTLVVQIKEAIETALTALVTDSKACYISTNSYTDPFADAARSASPGVPSITVSFGEGTRLPATGHFKKQIKCQVSSEIRYAENDDTVDWDDVRHDQGVIDAEVEGVMFEDETWGDLAFDTDYVPEESAWSDKGMSDALVIQTYYITYHHTVGDPYNPY